MREITATLDRFSDLGVRLVITEYDHVSTDETAQADFLRNVLTLCFLIYCFHPRFGVEFP